MRVYTSCCIIITSSILPLRAVRIDGDNAVAHLPLDSARWQYSNVRQATAPPERMRQNRGAGTWRTTNGEAIWSPSIACQPTMNTQQSVSRYYMSMRRQKCTPGLSLCAHLSTPSAHQSARTFWQETCSIRLSSRDTSSFHGRAASENDDD